MDQQKLDAFMGKFVGDLGAALHAGTVVLGEQLGLYKALAVAPMTSAELAEKTNTSERYVREWLAAQAASGYAMYDPATSCYSLSEEQAFALATEGSPAYIPGAFQLTLGALKSVSKLAQVFRSGLGFGWHQHDAWLFEGTEKFFRPGYAANLTANWIPALEGVEAKLKKGAKVADVGCGHGASTILMAQSYPHSTFTGFDYHGPSIEWARKAAQAAGVAGRVSFEVAPAKEFPGGDYDLVAMFDCLHDMGDPAGRLGARAEVAASRRHLDDRGTVRQRQGRGQPQPGRPRVLRRLDAHLHALLQVAGGRPGAGRPGRRGQIARSRNHRRVHAIPARHADAFQPHP